MFRHRGWPAIIRPSCRDFSRSDFATPASRQGSEPFKRRFRHAGCARLLARYFSQSPEKYPKALFTTVRMERGCPSGCAAAQKIAYRAETREACHAPAFRYPGSDPRRSAPVDNPSTRPACNERFCLLLSRQTREGPPHARSAGRKAFGVGTRKATGPRGVPPDRGMDYHRRLSSTGRAQEGPRRRIDGSGVRRNGRCAAVHGGPVRVPDGARRSRRDRALHRRSHAASPRGAPQLPGDRPLPLLVRAPRRVLPPVLLRQ